ncbi:MAG: CDP-glycerol glycerophosphotransferase family protein, partial [Thermoplasmata archaeon]
ELNPPRGPERPTNVNEPLEGPGRKNVLFLSSGETISRMFASVIRALNPKHHRTLVVNQDFYYGEKGAKILETAGAATRSLREYGTYNTRAILRKEGPDVLVVGHAGGVVERAFIASCRSLEIPTLLLQDGIIGQPAPLTFRDSVSMATHMISSFLANPRAVARHLFFVRSFGPRNLLHAFASWSKVSHEYARERCTKAAVMGPYAKRVFAKLGYEAEDVVVTGQPRFDALEGLRDSKEATCLRLGLDRSQRTLLVATPVLRNAEQRAAFMAAIIRAANRVGQLNLVVKVHPREATEPYHELMREEGAGDALVIADFPVPSLLHACDLLVSSYSTMALEALIVGKPVVVLNIPGEAAYYPFGEQGVSATASDELELEGAIRELLLNGGETEEMAIRTQRFVREHAYARDGRSSERVAGLIRDLSASHVS